MSSNNNSEEATAFGLIFAGMAMIGIFLAVLAAFLALALTVAYAFALDGSYKIGKLEVTPEEARAFIGGGIAGAVVVPLFIAFFGLLLNMDIDWTYWPQVLLGGYTLGSFGTVMVLTKMAENEAAEAQPEPKTINQTAQRSLPPSPPAQFQFASWDDEEVQ